MNLNYQPFIQTLQRLQTPVKDRHRIAAIAIGYAIACNSILPSSEVDNVETHYANTINPFAQQVISGFNEATLIDTTAALEFARKFWIMRYEAVHKCPRMETIPGDFFCSVFGVAKFFSAEDITFANTNSKEISFVYNNVCNLIKDLFVEKWDGFKYSPTRTRSDTRHL